MDVCVFLIIQEVDPTRQPDWSARHLEHTQIRMTAHPVVPIMTLNETLSCNIA